MKGKITHGNATVTNFIALLTILMLLEVTYSPGTLNVESSPILPGENDYALMSHKLTGLPVSYSINPRGSRGIPENEVVSIIRRAFEEWDDQVPVELFDDNLTIIRGPVTESNRENLVYLTTMASCLSGLTYCPTNYDQTFYVEINRAEPSDNKGLLEVALHEVGHVLGLGHPDRTGTRMVPAAENLLALSDILGVKTLYGEWTRVYSTPNNWSAKVSPLFSTPIKARLWLENNGVDYVMIENFEWPLVTESNWIFELSSGRAQYRAPGG